MMRTSNQSAVSGQPLRRSARHQALTPAAASSSSASSSSGTHGPKPSQAGNKAADFKSVSGLGSVKQVYPDSCWAACTGAICNLQKKSAPSDRTIAMRLGKYVNNNVEEADIAAALKAYSINFSSDDTDACVTIDEAHGLINQNTPLVMCLTNTPMPPPAIISGAHYVLITGASQTDNVVEITNPSDGQKTYHHLNITKTAGNIDPPSFNLNTTLPGGEW